MNEVCKENKFEMVSDTQPQIDTHSMQISAGKGKFSLKVEEMIGDVIESCRK